MPIVPLVSTVGLNPRFVVGVTGDNSEVGAICIAARLAEEQEGSLEVVTAGDRMADHRVRTQLDRLARRPRDYSHTIVSGDMVAELARISRERQAVILVIGFVTASDRRVAAALAAIALTPVLAVPTDVQHLFRRAALALDFSRASLLAAATALRFLDRPARAVMISAGAPSEALEPHIELLFDAAEDSFGRPRDVAIERYRAPGEPAVAILRAATTYGADLITLGRCGRSMLKCKPGNLGPVARTVLERAPCSVLIAPQLTQ